MPPATEEKPVALGVLISGRGSNLRAIGEAIAEGRLLAEIRVVISNRADAPGLDWAREHGLDPIVMSQTGFGSREAYDRALVEVLQAKGVKLVCLAGFMRLLSAPFFDAFPQAVLNVHPSLLPAFPGKDAQAQALAHGVKVSGVTVHFVTPELDNGPIVQQAPVPVREGDTCETLSARILVEEHRVYPEAIQRIIDGGWRIEGRCVVLPS
jgi:phosphoribosylglycinamide formyltransferase-1